MMTFKQQVQANVDVRDCLLDLVAASGPVTVVSCVRELRDQCLTWHKLSDAEKDATFSDVVNWMIREKQVEISVDTMTGVIALDSYSN